VINIGNILTISFKEKDIALFNYLKKISNPNRSNFIINVLRDEILKDRMIKSKLKRVEIDIELLFKEIKLRQNFKDKDEENKYKEFMKQVDENQRLLTEIVDIRNEEIEIEKESKEHYNKIKIVVRKKKVILQSLEFAKIINEYCKDNKIKEDMKKKIRLLYWKECEDARTKSNK